MDNLIKLVNTYFAERTSLSPDTAPKELKDALDHIFKQLESGALRVAEGTEGQWTTHTWIKEAILLSFRVYPNVVVPAGYTNFYDKVALAHTQFTEQDFNERGIRVVPGAVVRKGAYLGKNVVLMPSFINTGAYVGEGTMVDTWATVGSCAQIGKRVHLSGGVGIGGVLEPLQSNPVIIEDDCFIGARSEVVEGVIVEAGSVIGMGVFLGQSTKIYDRANDTVSYGRIPAGSVVVPGSLPDSSNRCQLACAVIVKQVDLKTRLKTSLNDLLRA